HVGSDPESGELEAQGLGWKSGFATGMGGDAITRGLEVTWTTTPTKWSNDFFKHLFGYEWELTKSPAGAHQWKPKGGAGAGTVPSAHDASKRIAPNMLTTDLALRFDPAYEKISRRFLEHPEQFADAFARAWFKLTHRDMRCGIIRRARAGRGRLPQLPENPLERSRRSAASRQSAASDLDCAGDDGAVRRPARVERQRRAEPTRRPHEAPGGADQRLLQAPARHEHAVDGDLGGEGGIRGPRSQQR